MSDDETLAGRSGSGKREWIQRRGLESVGEPVWARCAPPFMPWFSRRNEIGIELRGDREIRRVTLKTAHSCSRRLATTSQGPGSSMCAD
jgi:hypothetical protein